jgi:hypothetical protein
MSQRNRIKIPSSPTASDLIPRIASKTSLSVTLEKEKSSLCNLHLCPSMDAMSKHYLAMPQLTIWHYTSIEVQVYK